MIAGLYRRYAPELVRYIRKFTEDQAAAEDIVQETFVRGMEHGSQLEVLEESQRRAWLCQKSTGRAALGGRNLSE